MEWKSVKDELPKELFTYGCESSDVLIAAKPYGVWEYGIAYVVRTTDGVEWYSSQKACKVYPEYWKDIDQPTI